MRLLLALVAMLAGCLAYMAGNPASPHAASALPLVGLCFGVAGRLSAKR